MADALGNVNVAPGSTSVPFTTNIELLAATGSGYNQDGVTLAVGQGVLAVGTPLYRDSSGFYRKVGNRTVTDGATTSGSTTVTSATANFTSADIGATISGTDLPAGTTIVSVTNSTTVVVSAAATATGTAESLTISDNSECVGFLRDEVDTGATTDIPKLGNRVYRGVLKYSVVKAANGGVDLAAAVLTAVGGRVDTVRDYLIF